MTSIPPRFCPFCRECFEGVADCPDHEMALVDFDKLPREKQEDGEGNELLRLHDLRFGRAAIVVGFVVTTVAFFLPFVRVANEASFSAASVALARAPNLWAAELAAVGCLVMTFRAPTPARLRALRLAAALLAALGAVAVGFTWWRIAGGAAQTGVSATVEWGAVVLCLGLGILVFGGTRLGRPGPGSTATGKLL